MAHYIEFYQPCQFFSQLKDKQQGMIFTLEEAQSLSNVADVCIAKKDWIRETVNERITWSKNYISGKAVVA